ncbi:MAG TPA: hypothetical protein VFV38_22780 [Ktedonobacteraceae bacterium]|nr:hypothetical protein [Ktedonobacteraceae bacterium]
MMRRVLFLLMLMLLVCLQVACGDAYAPASDAGGPVASPSSSSQATTLAQAATGKFQEFALPQDNSGLMRPALDGQGRLWFGEMNRNYLASFDPRTGTFWQQTPPDGKAGIMGLVAAPDNTIWFTEQYANYIGHYFPITGQYKVYPLPTLHVPDPGNASKTLILPSAPNDIILDQHGTLWFTELNANALGSLNTSNGSIQQYPLTRAKNAKSLDPYGITADLQGQIWFTEASSSRLGRLNPLTGQIDYFTPPGITMPLMEVTSDAHGQIWATTFTVGLLIHFDPTSGQFTNYSAPVLNGGNAGGLYGLALSRKGDVWVTVSSQNMLARLDVKARRFFYYTIPTGSSLPIGLAIGKNQAVWFTESGSNKIGLLQP